MSNTLVIPIGPGDFVAPFTGGQRMASEVLKELIEGNHLDTVEGHRHARSRLRDMSDNVYYQTGIAYLVEGKVMGTREALANSIVNPKQGQAYPRQDPPVTVNVPK